MINLYHFILNSKNKKTLIYINNKIAIGEFSQWNIKFKINIIQMISEIINNSTLFSNQREKEGKYSRSTKNQINKTFRTHLIINLKSMKTQF